MAFPKSSEIPRKWNQFGSTQKPEYRGGRKQIKIERAQKIFKEKWWMDDTCPIVFVYARIRNLAHMYISRFRNIFGQNALIGPSLAKRLFVVEMSTYVIINDCFFNEHSFESYWRAHILLSLFLEYSGR